MIGWRATNQAITSRFAIPARRRLARAGLALALAITAGCAGAVAPTYTPEELQQHCVRDGGWWRNDALRGGYCEFQSPGALI